MRDIYHAGAMPIYVVKGKPGIAFAWANSHVPKKDSCMARRKSKKKPTFRTLAWVELPEQKTNVSSNDNKKTPISGLSFRAQKQLDKRADDLSWQIKFAKMKLHHWTDVDDLSWEPLDKLLTMAQLDLAKFGPV